MSILGAQFAKSSHCLDATAISTKCKSITISAIKDFLVGLGGSRSLLSEVEKLLALVLVMPAINASSERSFSALRRMKTYLRSTMSQSRLNHLMVLHVHKSLIDQLNLIDCANDFVSCNTHRLNLFGKFSYFGELYYYYYIIMIIICCHPEGGMLSPYGVRLANRKVCPFCRICND